MNFNSNNQALDNAGRLFDANGPSSLGNLPRADMIARKDVYREYFTTPVQQREFPIGAITRTPPISTEMLDRGRVELRRRQQPRRHSVMEGNVEEVQQFTADSMRNVRLSNSYISETEQSGELDFEYRNTNVVNAEEAAPQKPSGRPTPPGPAGNFNATFTSGNQSSGNVSPISAPNVGPSQLPSNQGMGLDTSKTSLTPVPANNAVPNTVIVGNGNSSGVV